MFNYYSQYWNPFFYGFGDPFVYGTNGHDSVLLNRQDAVVVNTLNGDDKLSLFGSGDYQVSLGQGDDTLNIYASEGIVDADGGAGSDRFNIKRLGDYRLDGDSGNDSLSFKDLDHGIQVDLSGEGPARAWSPYPVQDANLDWGMDESTIEFFDIETIYGTDHADRFIGSEAADRFYTGDGGDGVEAGGGNDYVVSGRGTDKISLGQGNDIAYGGDGNDGLNGGEGNDRLFGQKGDDALRGGEGDDYLLGGDGNDFLIGGGGADRIYGGDGADYIAAVWDLGDQDSSNDFFSGGANGHGDTIPTQVDTLSYIEAHGSIHIDVDAKQATGDGAGTPIISNNGPYTSTLNFIDTFVGFERYIGSDYDDTFKGSNDASVEEYFLGGFGDDVFYASAGTDHFFGLNGAINDSDFDIVDYSKMSGSVVANLSTGQSRFKDSESSQVYTHNLNGIDGLTGSSGRDTLIGNDGDNRVEGGADSDALTGRDGADTFVFNGAVGELGYDTIRDFGTGDDVIELAGLHFVTGAEASSFDAFDSNNDGLVTALDDQVFQAGGDMILLFEEAIIAINNVDVLHVDDFAFA